MHRDEKSSLYNGRSIDASYKVLVHLAKRFQRRLFRNRPIRNKNCLWWPFLLTDQEEMSNHYREPSIHASYQVSIHLAKRFQMRRVFRNRPIRNKNCLQQSCLLMDLDKISNLHRGPAIDASHQVSVHLAKQFEKNFKSRPIRNKNRLWWPCLLMDPDKLSNLYRGLPIDNTYQVSVYLAKRFQKR